MLSLVNCILEYETVNKDTGAVHNGINLYYISPLSEYSTLSYYGYFPSKISIDKSLVDKYNLKKIKYPFTCEFSFILIPLPNGKCLIKLDKIDNIKSLELFK